MKKYFAIVLACILLLNTLPLGASATEADQEGYDSLVRKASIAFPEHADKMNNPEGLASAYSRNGEPREVLIKDTRAVSEEEFVTYTEYSDGLILLSGYKFTADSEATSNVQGATSRDITIDIEATCVNDTPYKGYFYLEGVSYSLKYSDYDCITNTGTASSTGYCTKATRFLYNKTETDTSYAELGYELHFQIGPTGYHTVDSVLILWVGEDTAVLEHIDHNDYV